MSQSSLTCERGLEAHKIRVIHFYIGGDDGDDDGDNKDFEEIDISDDEPMGRQSRKKKGKMKTLNVNCN